MDTDDNLTVGQGRPRKGLACSDRLDPAGPVLTSTLAAARLQLNHRTLIEQARAGQLPGARLGKDWRFAAAALDAAVRGWRWDNLPFEDGVLTSREVAELLGIGIDKVGRLARSSVLPHWQSEGGRRRFSRAAVLNVLCGASGNADNHDENPSTGQNRTA